MIIRYGYASIKKDRISDVQTRARELERLTHTEAGCLDYHFGWSFSDSTQLCLIERWRGEDAYATHTAASYVADFGTFMKETVVAPPRFTSFTAAEQGH